MNFKINFSWMLVTIISFGIGMMTLLGYTQQYVKFQSSLNEIVFFVFCFLLGIFTAGASIEVNKNIQK